MLDHLGFVVRDLTKSRAFYEAVFAPLGFVIREDHGKAVIFARPDNFFPFVFLGEGRPSFWTAQSQPGTSPAHYAFQAPSRAAVDAFHAAGLAAGGRDNGAPRQRHPDYYAAFLLDPDDNNVEAGWRTA